MYTLYMKNKFLFLLLTVILTNKLMRVIGLTTSYFLNYQMGYILDMIVSLIIVLIILKIYEKREQRKNQ